MARVGVIIVAVVVLMATVFAVPSLHARVIGVPLALKFVVGAESHTTTTIDGKLKLDAKGLPPMYAEMTKKYLGADIPFKIQLREKEVVKSVEGDVAEVDLSVEDGNFQINLPGMERPYSQAIPPSSGGVNKVHTNGSLDLDGTDKTSALSSDEAKQVGKFFNDMFAGYLPGANERIGQSWTTTPSIDFNKDSAKIKVTGTSANTFVDVEKRGSATVAKIASKMDVTIDITTQPSKGGNLTVSGKYSGQKDGYFDWANGYSVGSEGDGNLDLDVTLKVPKGVDGMKEDVDATAHLSGSAKMSMDRT